MESTIDESGEGVTTIISNPIDIRFDKFLAPILDICLVGKQR